MATKRSRAGEGSISTYKLKNGDTRYLVKIRVQTPEGESRQVLRRGFRTEAQAVKERRRMLAKAESAEGYTEPSKQTVKAFLNDWVDGLRLAPSTVASYRRVVRLHVVPYVGGVQLGKLSSTKIKAMYKALEAERSERTVTYAGTILQKALKDAVQDGLIPTNPCERAKPPRYRGSPAKEIRSWTVEQTKQFLSWVDATEINPSHKVLFHLALASGARRGEMLALRWRDVDIANCRISIRRSLGEVKVKGQPPQLVEGSTKTGKERVVDLNATMMKMLVKFKTDRAALAFELGTPDALVFGDLNGDYVKPSSQTWAFNNAQRNFLNELVANSTDDNDLIVAPVDSIPRIRFHDMRHTHASILLAAGEHPKVVQERLGHSDITVTMNTYSHVLPTMQKQAASAIESALFGT